MRGIVWFRRDLRLTDQSALAAACAPPHFQSRPAEQKARPRWCLCPSIRAELKTVSNKWIHEPHLMARDEQLRCACRIGIDYPSPIVDHQRTRREYVDLGKQPVMR
jgi:deoxyribodipyrimidine photolyase